MNLLSNAVKFTNSGGVTFKVGYVGAEVWSRGQVEHYEFSILSSELKQNYLRFIHNYSAAKHDLKIRFQVKIPGNSQSQQVRRNIFALPPSRRQYIC